MPPKKTIFDDFVYIDNTKKFSIDSYIKRNLEEIKEIVEERLKDEKEFLSKEEYKIVFQEEFDEELKSINPFEIYKPNPLKIKLGDKEVDIDPLDILELEFDKEYISDSSRDIYGRLSKGIEKNIVKMSLNLNNNMKKLLEIIKEKDNECIEIIINDIRFMGYIFFSFNSDIFRNEIEVEIIEI